MFNLSFYGLTLFSQKNNIVSTTWKKIPQKNQRKNHLQTNKLTLVTNYNLSPIFSPMYLDPFTYYRRAMALNSEYKSTALYNK